MFCEKNSMTGMMLCMAGVLVTMVGAITIIGFVIAKCDCLRGKTRYLAHECGEAVGNAAEKITHAVGDCMKMNCDCDEK